MKRRAARPFTSMMSLTLLESEPEPSTLPEQPFEIRRITLAGRCELEYVDRGDLDAPVAIFLHGLSDSWLSFADVLNRCPDDLRCIAISQRGHGDSERPPSGYRLVDLADDVIAFMNALGIERASIVGHSMGSLVAQTIAAKYPDRVTRLVLVGSATSFDAPATREFEALLRTLEDIPHELAFDFQGSTFYHPIPDAMLDTFVAESMKVPARVWRDTLAGVLEHDGPACLAAIEAPTAIIWGAQDAYCPHEEQLLLRGSIRHSRLVIYEDVGHAPHWEEPDHVSREIVAFLRPKRR
jgi:non-heme chloroperoxidase